jgi:hypothetical protein
MTKKEMFAGKAEHFLNLQRALVGNDSQKDV